uniref:Putative secreted protein n=1 Tax=Panstrongylus lignarius TaxID=156445 RepID=A0A224XSY0_9HEMI
MTTSLLAISTALIALLGNADSMAIDGARSLSCCGRATYELQSDHIKLEAAQKKNDRANLETAATELQNSTLGGADTPTKEDDKPKMAKQQQKKKCTRSVEGQQNDQLVNIQNRIREHVALRDILTNAQMDNRKSFVKLQTNRKIIDSPINAENLDLSTKSPVPPEPLTALKRLVEADERSPDKYVDQKNIESVLKENKKCDKKKKTLN